MSTQSSDAAKRRLAVAMIVRDEEAVLAESIESVRTLADDVYVLDTGSSDGTVELAERLGARVGEAPWSDDFSAARNLLANEIEADWILWLDAGERIVPETAGMLRKFVDGHADPGKVYVIMVSVPSATPDGSAEQTAQARLVPKHSGLLFWGRIRETLMPAMETLGLQCDFAPGQIVRHAREHDRERKAAIARRNLGLIALEAAEGPLSARLLIAQGDAHVALGDVPSAREAFSQAVATAQRGWPQMLEAYYGLLATFDGDASQSDRQLSVGLEALEIYPLDAQLLCAMGNYLQQQNRLDLAVRSFDTAAKYGQVDLETWHLAEVGEMAAVCLALAWQLQGEDDEAHRVLEDAHRRYPDSVRVRRHLLDLYVKRNEADQAVRLAEAMCVEGEDFEPWRNAVLGACKAATHDWLPALGYLQSAYVGGCREPFCLRWLTVTLLSSGQTEPIRPVLAEWLRAEPGSVEVQQYLKAIQPAEDEDARRIRVDSTTSVEHVISPNFPIIGRCSTIDTATEGSSTPEQP